MGPLSHLLSYWERLQRDKLIPAAEVLDIEPDYLPLLYHSILWQMFFFALPLPLRLPTNFLFFTENTVSQVSKS